MFEIKYLECVTGITLGSHEEFLRKLQEQSLCLKKLSSLEKCDVILAFCPVVSREGTDIEAALKQLPSETKPTVLVVLHNTFDKDKFVSDDASVSRENTIRVDCLFHENEGLLNCQRNNAAISKVRDWLQKQVSKRIPSRTERFYESGKRQKLDSEKEPLNTVSVKTPAAPPRRQNSMGIPPLMSGQCSGPHSPVSVPVAELRLVLLGRTGSGKSAAVNTILGKEERSQADTSRVRQQSKSRQGEVAGRQVTVVDTPDWFCPELSEKEVRKDVELCVQLSAPGPHAFLLVLPLKQSAGDVRGIFEKMEEIFGELCWRNTIILFTSTDEQEKMDIEYFLQSGKQEVQRFVEKCGNRFHCLNIKKSGDGSQVLELLKKIEDILPGNRETFYNIEVFRETESQIREIKNKIMNYKEKAKQKKELNESFENEEQNLVKNKDIVLKEDKEHIKCTDQITKLERRNKVDIDEVKKRELELDLERDAERKTNMEENMKIMIEQFEREKNELKERHKQEMEDMVKKYEGEARMEVEKILSVVRESIFILMSKFSKQMEERDREVERLRLSETSNREKGQETAEDGQEHGSWFFSCLPCCNFFRRLFSYTPLQNEEESNHQ